MKITNAFYAAIGAPVLAGRKLVEVGGKVASALRDGVEASTEEGRVVADKFGDGNVVEELSHRLEVDERVGKLREQVEGVVDKWRDGFQADKKESAKAPAKKAAAKKSAAKKPAAKKAAAKKPAAKKPAAKKAAATKPAAEEPVIEKPATEAKAEEVEKVEVSS